MFKMQRVRRGVFITLLLATAAAPLQAHAVEPLTLYLLKMLRDQMVSSAVESAVNGAQSQAQAVPSVKALEGVYGISEAQLRGLIDTGFVHLSAAQRTEIYNSLASMLADPKNASARPLIIEELALKAAAVRGALERLSSLSAAEKRAIVADARSEYERMNEDERSAMVRMLQSRVAPIPRDLNDLMLAEFSGVQAVAAADAPAP